VQIYVLTVRCMRIVMPIMAWRSKFIWTMTEFATEVRITKADAGGISYVSLNRHIVPIVTGCADFGTRHRK
jgi:hypothetical protein